MSSNRAQDVVDACMQAAESIAAEVEAAERRIRQVSSQGGRAGGAETGDPSDRISLALGTMTAEKLESMHADCDELRAAGRRAVDLSDGRLQESGSRETAIGGGSRRPLPAPLSGLPDAAAARSEGGIRPLLRAVRAHRSLVALATLAALVGAIVFLSVREPSYEATASVLVSPLPQDTENFLTLGLIRDSGDAIRTTQTAATLLDSVPAAQQTAAELGDDWTQERVIDKVDVAPQGESNVIAITGTANDAALSAELADTFTQATLEIRNAELQGEVATAIARVEAEVEQLEPGSLNAIELSSQLTELRSIEESGDPTLTLQQAATVPESPENPGAPIVLALALIAGLTLGSGGALLREFFDRRIIDADDAAGIYPLPVLARVPVMPEKSLRGPSGTSWYLPPEIREAFQTLVVQLEQRDPPPEVLMVTSPTRRDGKTTSAINLAVTLAATGKQVILFDFDLRNPQVGRSLGIKRAVKPGELGGRGQNLDRLLTSSALPTLRVLPVAGQQNATAGEMVTSQLLELMRQARRVADYVVVDTPPLGEVSDALRLIREVDDVLVVLRPGNTSRAHLGGMRDLLERMGHTPEGSILIDTNERASGGYHSFGYRVAGGEDLAVGQVEESDRGPGDRVEEVQPLRK